MIKVANKTRGIICVDVPSENAVVGDSVVDLLKSIDFSQPTKPEDALRVLVGLEIAKRQEARLAQEMSTVALRRAKETVDLLPEYQGEDRPKHVNEVEKDIWKKIEKLPPIAARLAAGELQVANKPF